MFKSREELAWAAGFFEGEGSFTLNRSRLQPRPQPHLTISQVERAPLERFMAAIGGFGHIYGPYVHDLPGRRGAIHRYRMGRFEHVQATVCFLWPWLSAWRRKQAVSI